MESLWKCDNNVTTYIPARTADTPCRDNRSSSPRSPRASTTCIPLLSPPKEGRGLLAPVQRGFINTNRRHFTFNSDGSAGDRLLFTSFRACRRPSHSTVGGRPCCDVTTFKHAYDRALCINRGLKGCVHHLLHFGVRMKLLLQKKNSTCRQISLNGIYCFICYASVHGCCGTPTRD